MRTIVNKTHRPLKVPLPQGRVLHLGPGKEGQVSDKAVDHPGVQRLVEAGDVELQAVAGSEAVGHGASGAVQEATHGHTPKPVHVAGDR